MTAEKKTEAKVVKNGSKGYGYTYSNLADLAKAGINIPKMRIKPTEFGEYLEYKDSDGEWQLGAKIVVPDMKGMNAAQAYGSALTYARRYTVQMAESVACDDDDAIENTKGSAKPKAAPRKIEFKDVWSKVKTLNTEKELEDYWRSIQPLSEAQKKALAGSFADRKKEIQDGLV